MADPDLSRTIDASDGAAPTIHVFFNYGHFQGLRLRSSPIVPGILPSPRAVGAAPAAKKRKVAQTQSLDLVVEPFDDSKVSADEDSDGDGEL